MSTLIARRRFLAVTTAVALTMALPASAAANGPEDFARSLYALPVDNFGETILVTLDLFHTSDGWRLADVHGPDGASLVAEPKRLNANG